MVVSFDISGIAASARPSAPALSARGIVKRFGDIVANDRVDFEVRYGEVHALLGENGAGKSTLVKVLYGFHAADAGEIFVDGVPVQIRSPAAARRLGIGMVFQHFTLIPALTVTENIALHLRDLPPFLPTAALSNWIREVSRRYGLAVDPMVLAGRLSVGEQQRVEVLRLLLAGARILILDEPTSVLPPHEIDSLFAVVRRLAAAGLAIVLITHKLREVLQCADRVTVMRHGVVTGTLPVSEATEEKLIALMFGRDLPPSVRRRSGASVHPPVLELRGVCTSSARGRPLRGVTLALRPGEILGVAGVAGNGQQELADAILGVEPLAAGSKFLFGEDASRWTVSQLLERGVACIPENPATTLVTDMTVEENFALISPRRYARWRGFRMDWAAVRTDLAAAENSLGVAFPPPSAYVGTLSGGTIQRFAVARELARRPRVLVAVNPTKGLDVSTAAAVRDLLLEARSRGTGILLISLDLAEVIALSDRIVVLRDGRIVAEVSPENADPYTLGRLMTGGEA
jgi:simple sugar transport system ATP-binding protein